MYSLIDADMWTSVEQPLQNSPHGGYGERFLFKTQGLGVTEIADGDERVVFIAGTALSSRASITYLMEGHDTQLAHVVSPRFSDQEINSRVAAFRRRLSEEGLGLIANGQTVAVVGRVGSTGAYGRAVLCLEADNLSAMLALAKSCTSPGDSPRDEQARLYAAMSSYNAVHIDPVGTGTVDLM